MKQKIEEPQYLFFATLMIMTWFLNLWIYDINYEENSFQFMKISFGLILIQMIIIPNVWALIGEYKTGTDIGFLILISDLAGLILTGLVNSNRPTVINNVNCNQIVKLIFWFVGIIIPATDVFVFFPSKLSVEVYFFLRMIFLSFEMVAYSIVLFK